MLSIYIHIPFCRAQCPYCDFAIHINSTDDIFKQYTQAIIQEIRQYSDNTQPIYTIYFGGGTPSVLPLIYFEEIMVCIREEFDCTQIQEITLEMNPETVNKDNLQYYKNIGINRLSLGVQTFNDNLLKKLGRQHNLEHIINSLNLMKTTGFRNISIDLIYGLPGQTIEEWQYSINEFLQFDLPHISLYSLMIEENTPYAKLYINNNHPSLPNESNIQEFYKLIYTSLFDNNYKQYEVSNFAREQYQSKHNQHYWSMGEYYGFGVGSHGFVNNQRYSHSKNIFEYINNPLQHHIEPCDIEFERNMLALRTHHGIPYINLTSKDTVVNKLIDENLLEILDKNIRLTSEGFLVSNEIIAKLLL